MLINFGLLSQTENCIIRHYHDYGARMDFLFEANLVQFFFFFSERPNYTSFLTINYTRILPGPRELYTIEGCQ